MNASPQVGEQMHRVPGMIIIGSAGRNSGKTEFACALISSLKPTSSVIGIKVSTIYGDGRVCLRGNVGCGVCTSLEGDYCLTEEHDPARPKDTGRMLAAGADRVYWLQVREGHLAEGLTAFLNERRNGELIVCESNGLRTVCEPDLFLMMKSATDNDSKRSARTVMQLADRVVKYDGERFDLEIGDVRHADDTFLMTSDAAAVLLAGGKSSRMDADKRFLQVAGRPLIHHVYSQLASMFDVVIISVGGDGLNGNGVTTLAGAIAGPGVTSFNGALIVADESDDVGPIGGIVTALASSDRDLNLVTACDIPEIPRELVRVMLHHCRHHDVVVPRYPDGTLEPLFAVYRTSILPTLRSLLASGVRRPRRLFGVVDTFYVDLPEAQRLKNLNTPADYRLFVRGA